MQETIDQAVARILERESVDDSLDMKEIDSLARAEIIVMAEEMYKLSLSNEQILGLKTLGDLKALVK